MVISVVYFCVDLTASKMTVNFSLKGKEILLTQIIIFIIILITTIFIIIYIFIIIIIINIILLTFITVWLSTLSSLLSFAHS